MLSKFWRKKIEFSFSVFAKKRAKSFFLETYFGFNLSKDNKTWDKIRLKLTKKVRAWGLLKDSYFGYHDTQHNDIQYNNIQHNDTQNNDTQHNDA